MVLRFIGKVTSNKMMKSIVVTVTYLRKVPKYHVWRRFQSKIMAHDELNECHIGDTVRIESCRPLSRKKAYRVTELLTRAPQFTLEAKTAAEKAAEVAMRLAEGRRHALENELTSRRHEMDKEAIVQAEKEIAERPATISRMAAHESTLRELREDPSLYAAAETLEEAKGQGLGISIPSTDPSQTITSLGGVGMDDAAAEVDGQNIKAETETSPLSPDAIKE